MPAEGPVTNWAEIFCPEIDRLTHQLEKKGYRIWFTTEVAGIEYRLASPK